jgi:predicted nucleic acid-binding protein
VPFVLDANTVVAACLSAGAGFDVFGDEQLSAPDLMWWEAASTLHEYVWRIEADRRTPDMAHLTRDDVLTAFSRLHAAPIERVPVDEDVLDEAWDVSSRCGFARLYDAAYVALAQLRRATLVTLDGRLKNSPASKLVKIVGPADLT